MLNPINIFSSSPIRNVLLYSVVIVSVLIWSGLRTEKTLYDYYAARFERIELRVTDYNSVVKFYTDVLDFSPAPIPRGANKAEGSAYFHLPGSKTLLHLIEGPSTSPRSSPNSATRIVLRVKNGFTQLHKKINEKSKRPLLANTQPTPEELFPAQVSAIFDSPNGETFYVKDPAENTFVFQRVSKLSALTNKRSLIKRREGSKNEIKDTD